MTKTKIEWTESTWNPSVGCSKVSADCQNCYAEAMARRLRAMGVDGHHAPLLPTLNKEGGEGEEIL